MNAGHFEMALENFEKANEMDPENPTLRGNLSFCYRKLALEALKKGEDPGDWMEKSLELTPGDSATLVDMAAYNAKMGNSSQVSYYLSQALEDEKIHPEVMKTAAGLYRKMKMFGDAIALLERANEQKPSADNFLGLAANARDSGDMENALYYVEKGLELDPEDATLKQFHDRVKRENQSEEKMVKQLTNHFTIRFDGDQPAGAVDFILENCEEAYLRVGEVLYWYPDHVTEVIVYTRREYDHATGAPSWSGGQYDGKLRIPLVKGQDKKELRNTLFHEYAHMVISCLSDNHCPYWLNEGIAQAVEPENHDAAIFADLSNDYRDRKILPAVTAQYEGPFTELGDVKNVKRAYQISYLSARVLIQEKGTAGLNELLQSLKNSPCVESLEQLFGFDYQGLGERNLTHLRDYYRQRQAKTAKK